MLEIADLSLEEGLVSDLFTSPKRSEEWEQYKLTKDQIEFFNENGYLSGIKILEQGQIEVLKEELKSLTDPKHPGNPLFYIFESNESADPEHVLFHALGAWRITKDFHDLIWNPRFLVPASQLLGDRAIRLWHDQLFCKPAQHGGVVAWHQDYSYWTRTTPMAHLTCWCGLDDADTENGCLYYVPKSHRWGLLEKPELGGKMEGIFDYLNEEQKAQFKPIPIELKAGYASFHHPLMLHGSYENKTIRQRRAFVLNVFADGTRSASNEPLLPGTPAFKEGEKLDGTFYPLIFDPANI